MHLFADFNLPAQHLLERLDHLARSLPLHLGEPIRLQLRRRGLALPEAPGIQTVVFYLPFWAQDYLGGATEPAWLDDIAYANACGALAVLIQDDVLDGEVAAQDIPEWLATGNIFDMQSTLTYTRLFPAASPFWEHFQQVRPREWAGLLLERRRHWGQLAPFTDADIQLLGDKCSVGEISVAALALAAEMPEKREELVQMIRLAHIGVQFLDDLEDWRTDLQRGNYTPLITRLAGTDGMLKEEELALRLASTSVAEDLLAEAEAFVSQACRALRPTPSPYLPAFLEMLTSRMRRAVEQLRTNRMEVLQRYTQQLLHLA